VPDDRSAGDPIRLGLVGCGRIADRGYLPALALTRAVALAAVADLDEDRCARLAPGIPSYRSAETLLAEEQVGALVLATPTETHLADARAAAARGVAVLVEKPPAPDAGGAAELAALRPKPWIGFQRRFRPELAALREQARRAPEPEVVLELEVEKADWGAYVSNDDALLDLAPHLVDLAVWMTGRPVVAVSASVESLRAELELEFDSGRTRISCAHDRAYRGLFEVRSNGLLLGRVREGGMARRVATRLIGRGREPLNVALAAQLDALARAVAGGDPTPLADADDGLTAMSVLDAARRSAASGGSVVAVESA
jgi:myo-inositol 2-dehydrogenase/D-chiro-inositol 1-dehydrogenase